MSTPSTEPRAPCPRGRRPSIPFLTVGAGTAVVYVAWVATAPLLPGNVFEPLLDLGKITGYTWQAALRYCLVVGTLFVLYGVGYWLVVGRSAASLGPILGFAAVFCAVLTFAYPATAVDIFQYVAQGRLLAAHDVNPFVVAPAAYLGDAIIPYLAFPREPSQYGPLWAWIEGAIAGLAGADVRRLDERLVVELELYKLLGAGGQLLGAWLVFVLAERLGAARRRALGAAYLFAWNPLLLWEMVANGHNDGVMMLGGLLACLALTSSRYDVLTLPALALGALVKVPVAALAPLLALHLARRDWRRALLSLALAMGVLVIAYAPFWTGLSTLTFLQRGNLFTASLASCLVYLLLPLVGPDAAASLARGISQSMLAVAVVVILVRAVRAESTRAIVGLGYALLLALLLLGVTWFQAWYLVWPIALALPLASPNRQREVVLLTCGGFGMYLAFIYLWVMGVLPPHDLAVVQLVAYALLVGPLLLGWAIAVLQPLWEGRRWSQTSPAR
ncbi:MAG: hypothetical protein JO023_28575 [Chloroflexi bacterium]|nr:hypothetical protein [Chloroflexota bacterium]